MPSTLEEYVQEVGQSGWDGESSEAVLYQGKGGRNASSDVKKTLICRRRLLFKNFLMYSESDISVSGCKCCDVCQFSFVFDSHLSRCGPKLGGGFEPLARL